jgi:hypothetical protein
MSRAGYTSESCAREGELLFTALFWFADLFITCVETCETQPGKWRYARLCATSGHFRHKRLRGNKGMLLSLYDLQNLPDPFPH